MDFNFSGFLPALSRKQTHFALCHGRYYSGSNESSSPVNIVKPLWLSPPGACRHRNKAITDWLVSLFVLWNWSGINSFICQASGKLDSSNDSNSESVIIFTTHSNLDWCISVLCIFLVYSQAYEKCTDLLLMAPSYTESLR